MKQMVFHSDDPSLECFAFLSSFKAHTQVREKTFQNQLVLSTRREAPDGGLGNYNL